MSLLNLKSVFQEELELRSQDYMDRVPQHSNDSKLDYNQNSTISQTHGFDVPMNEPILDSLLRGKIYDPIRFSQNITGQKLFVTDVNANNGTHPFQNETFDPRIESAKAGTLYYNFDRTFNPATKDPLITFSTAGFNDNAYQSLEELGKDLGTSKGYQALYNNDHTPKPTPEVESLESRNPFTPYHYSSKVNRNKLDIRDNAGHFSLVSPSRTPLLGLGQSEPYIVSKIPEVNNDFFGTGRATNFGSREVPIARALTDTIRIGKYLSSPMGIANIALKNIYGNLIKTAVVPLARQYSFESRSKQQDALAFATSNVLGRDTFINEPLLTRVNQQYNKSDLAGISLTYNPLHTLLAVGTRVAGGGFPNVGLAGVKIESGGNLLDNNKYFDYGTGGLWNSINGFPLDLPSGLELGPPRPVVRSDVITTLDIDGNIGQGFDPNSAEGFDSYFEDFHEDPNSLPLYFIDLRDNKVTYFRGYLDGITENISPSWASTNYVGRSEPVYIYERTERDITFNLKLFAHTPTELEMIYKKMNRLTSFCYPEYAVDAFLKNQKLKMKPPLVKFRLGELYGRHKKELTGFLKALTYSIPEESTWESLSSEDFFGDQEVNRVPKHIVATVTYQVIHSTVPSLETAVKQEFYGYKKPESYEFL